jgi:cellulose synthase (UDP-forming)
LLYFYVQRFMCDPSTERGVHWRGLVLKFACWPVFLLGTVLAVARAEIPYIPTAKEAVRGRFLRLAGPQLVLMSIYAITLGHVVAGRLRASEGSLELSSEAVWGMLGFATLPVVLSAGGVYAAWRARRLPADAPWDSVDVTRLGGALE